MSKNKEDVREEKELVSIITPMYNSEEYIDEMIQSVRKQVYTNWELIIVDDCSVDKSLEIAKNYMKIDNRIKVLSNDVNSGPAMSRNKAIQESRGRFIAFLDSDDIWHPEKLNIQINYMLKNKSYISCTSYEMIHSDSRLSLGVFKVPTKITYKDMLKKNYFSCDTVVIDLNFISSFTMSSFKKHEDYITWLNIIKQVDYAHGIDEVLAYYRISNNTRSSNKLSNIIPLFQVYYTKEKLGFIKSISLVLMYCIRCTLKYRKTFLKLVD